MNDKYNIDGHKLQYHPERIAQWHEARTIEEKIDVYPIYVEISPVGQCNHRCTFCAVDYIGYVNRSIDTKILCSAIEDMSRCGVKSLMLAGEGEPMLHKDINEIVNFAYRKIDVGFTTNGTRMDEEFRLKSLPCCTFIKISMNGGTADVYSKIHQTKVEHFEMVWSNITAAVERKRALNLKVAIGIQCLLLPDNADSIHQLAKRCWEVGVDYLVLKPYSHKDGSLTTKYRDIKYLDLYDNVILNAQQFVSSTFEVIARRKTMEAWDDNNRGYSKCMSTPYLWAYLMSTGDLYACSAHLLEPEFNLGNINRDSFGEIWSGGKRRALIEKMETFDISVCRRNCRMNAVNKYLDSIANPGEHVNFI